VVNSITALIAAGGNPLALIPVLNGQLAADRHKLRIEKVLSELDNKFREHEEKLNELTDNQFKLINEGVSALLRTVDEEKISYLKKAVLNTLDEEELDGHNSVLLSRVLRDISVVELRFLLRIKNYSEIILYEPDKKSENEDNRLVISPESGDAATLSGLFCLRYLGLVAMTRSGYGGTVNYRVLQIAKRLAGLVT